MEESDMGEVISKNPDRSVRIANALHSADFKQISLLSNISPLVSNMAQIKELCVADLADPKVAFDCGKLSSYLAIQYLSEELDDVCASDFDVYHVRDTSLFNPNLSSRLHPTIQGRSKHEQKSFIAHDTVSGLYIDLTCRQFSTTTPSVLVSDGLSWWAKKVKGRLDLYAGLPLKRLSRDSVSANLALRRKWYGGTLEFDKSF